MIGNPLEISFKTLEITVFLLYSKGRIQKKFACGGLFPPRNLPYRIRLLPVVTRNDHPFKILLISLPAPGAI